MLPSMSVWASVRLCICECEYAFIYVWVYMCGNWNHKQIGNGKRSTNAKCKKYFNINIYVHKIYMYKYVYKIFHLCAIIYIYVCVSTFSRCYNCRHATLQQSELQWYGQRRNWAQARQHLLLQPRFVAIRWLLCWVVVGVIKLQELEWNVIY